jgi:hypothetical protein
MLNTTCKMRPVRGHQHLQVGILAFGFSPQIGVRAIFRFLICLTNSSPDLHLNLITVSHHDTTTTGLHPLRGCLRLIRGEYYRNAS